MITPTIGRQVWYWPRTPEPHEQPCAATVAYVHDERHVTLQVVDHEGRARPESNVLLRQPEDLAPLDGEYCEWMPFQVGQAKAQASEKTGGTD
jgi:hypothetical protein